MQRIQSGDQVEVTAGKDRGKRGRVMRVNTDDHAVVVEGVNIVKRHQRPMPPMQPGGIIEMPAPLAESNVKLVCPHCEQATRIGYRILDDGSKGRMCKGCQEIIGQD
jgi:large subunit ribosomal protein L24